jgi:hypothetical protein
VRASEIESRSFAPIRALARCHDPPTIASRQDLALRQRRLADDHGQQVADYEATVGGSPGIPALLAAMADPTGTDT